MAVDALQTLILACADLPRSIEFYVGLLRLPLVAADDSMAIVRAGLVQLVLDTAGGGESAPGGATLVFKVSDLNGLLSDSLLAACQGAVELTAANGRIVSLRDPDGRQVELTELAL